MADTEAIDWPSRARLVVHRHAAGSRRNGRANQFAAALHEADLQDDEGGYEEFRGGVHLEAVAAVPVADLQQVLAKAVRPKGEQTLLAEIDPDIEMRVRPARVKRPSVNSVAVGAIDVAQNAIRRGFVGSARILLSHIRTTP